MKLALLCADKQYFYVDKRILKLRMNVLIRETYRMLLNGEKFLKSLFLKKLIKFHTYTWSNTKDVSLSKNYFLFDGLFLSSVYCV